MLSLFQKEIMLKKLPSKWVKIAAQMDVGRRLWTTLQIQNLESEHCIYEPQHKFGGP